MFDEKALGWTESTSIPFPKGYAPFPGHLRMAYGITTRQLLSEAVHIYDAHLKSPDVDLPAGMLSAAQRIAPAEIAADIGKELYRGIVSEVSQKGTIKEVRQMVLGENDVSGSAKRAVDSSPETRKTLLEWRSKGDATIELEVGRAVTSYLLYFQKIQKIREEQRKKKEPGMQTSENDIENSNASAEIVPAVGHD